MMGRYWNLAMGGGKMMRPSITSVTTESCSTIDPSNELTIVERQYGYFRARTFASFGWMLKSCQTQYWGQVTKYEKFNQRCGVKVLQDCELSDDIALALAAKDMPVSKLQSQENPM